MNIFFGENAFVGKNAFFGRSGYCSGRVSGYAEGYPLCALYLKHVNLFQMSLLSMNNHSLFKHLLVIDSLLDLFFFIPTTEWVSV